MKALPLSSASGAGVSHLSLSGYSWADDRIELTSNAGSAVLAPVKRATWDFAVGGYQPAQKWLKDRRGRTLTPEDIEHYKRIIGAIEETIRIQKEIDEVIEAHGGWPGAFAVPTEAAE